MVIAGELNAGFINKLILAVGLINFQSKLMSQTVGPYCREKMERKCAIDTFYYPEELNTSEDQHIPIRVG